MNILDKMPKRLIELMLGQGLIFSLGSSNKHGMYLDLNTGMKSDLRLYYESGEYIARMRYGEEMVICDFNDLRYAISQCKHGRDYMNTAWVIPLVDGFGEFGDEPLDYL